MFKNQIAVVVTGARRLTPRINEYVLSSADGRSLPNYEAGAHISLFLATQDGPLVRQYSLVRQHGDFGEKAGTYRIAVQREDRSRGSAYVHDHFAVGTNLNISHPKCQFTLDRRDTKSLLIAGGIGITPILSMAQSLANRHRTFEMLYIGKRRELMAYLPEVEQLGSQRVTIHTTELPQDKRPNLATLLALQPLGTSVYVCGPSSLVRATQSAAAQSGWMSQRIHAELFTPASSGNENGFSLELSMSGRRLQVGPHTSILEAMTAAGMHPLFDCGRGECGLCPLPVLDADGPLTHRDRFLSDDEKASGKTLCICVSRVQGSRLVLAA